MKSRNLWHFHPQPTKQYMRSHLGTVCLNTLRGRGDSGGKQRKGSDSFLCIVVERRDSCSYSKINSKNYLNDYLMYVATLTHPKSVDSAHQLLVLCRYFLFNVVVKAWLYSEELRQGRKVVGAV